MLRRTSFVLGLGALMVAVWACTGDDPVTVQPGRGALGQSCNADSTCNVTDLVCTAGLCTARGSDGGPSSSSGSTTSSSGGSSSGASSSSSSSGDAAPPECKDFTHPGETLICPKSATEFQECAADSGKICCPGQGCITAANCGVEDDEWQCFAADQCAGKKCYVRQSDTKAGTTCGVPVEIGAIDTPHVSVGRCLPDPPGSPWTQLCNVEGDCDNTAMCVPAVIVVQGIKMIVKACKEH